MGNCLGRGSGLEAEEDRVRPRLQANAHAGGETQVRVSLTERAVHPLLLTALCQLEVVLPDGSTARLGDLQTHEVVTLFIKPETAGQHCCMVDMLSLITCGLTACSPSQHLVGLTEKYRQCAGGPKPFHGGSCFFVSHAWSYRLSDLRDLVLQHYEGVCGSEFKWHPVFYWIDILAVNQNFTGDFTDHPDGNFAAVIHASQGVVFTIHPWERPVAPRRIWCLFEALTALELGRDLEFQLDPGFRKQSAPLEVLEEKFRREVVNTLDVGKAQATVEDDRQYIMGLLEKRPGGVRKFNAMMQKLLKERMLEVLLMRAVLGQNVGGGAKMLAAGAGVSKKVLKFKFLRVTDTSLEILAPTLERNEALVTLDLTPPGVGLITHRGVDHLVAALTRNSTLQELILNNNPGITDGTLALASLLCTNTSLARLHLRKTGLDDAGLQALASSLATNKYIQLLDVSLNDDVSDSGLLPLLQVLHTNSSLQVLDISYLSLESRKVAKALAAMLEANRALEVLVVAHCHLNAEGLEAVAGAVAGNTYMRCLDLSGNIFGDEGCRLLSVALERNNFLEELHLRACDIGEDGARVLRAALAQSRGLERVNLTDNRVSAEQWGELVRRLGAVTPSVEFGSSQGGGPLAGGSSSTLVPTGAARRVSRASVGGAFGSGHSFFQASGASLALSQSQSTATFKAAFGSASYPLMMGFTASSTPRSGSMLDSPPQGLGKKTSGMTGAPVGLSGNGSATCVTAIQPRMIGSTVSGCGASSPVVKLLPPSSAGLRSSKSGSGAAPVPPVSAVITTRLSGGAATGKELSQSAPSSPQKKRGQVGKNLPESPQKKAAVSAGKGIVPGVPLSSSSPAIAVPVSVSSSAHSVSRFRPGSMRLCRDDAVEQVMTDRAWPS